MLQTVADSGVSVDVRVRAVHRLHDEAREVETHQGVEVETILRKHYFQFVTAALEELGPGFGRDAHPVNANRHGVCAVRLDGDGKAHGVEGVDELGVELQGRLAARADQPRSVPRGRTSTRPACGRSVRQRLRRVVSAAAGTIDADEVGVAERAGRRCAVGAAPVPEVAAGEATEHRGSSRVRALALEREEELLDRVSHAYSVAHQEDESLPRQEEVPRRRRNTRHPVGALRSPAGKKARSCLRAKSRLPPRAMPATTTIRGPVVATPRRQDLALGERGGSLSAVAVDILRLAPGPEPIGELVEMRVLDDEVRFEWGQPWELGTAAYWAEQTRRRPPVTSHALGESLAEEVAACLLGGHGIPAAVGLAAFYAARDAGLLDQVPTVAALHGLLCTPLHVPGRPRPVRYRFAAQRAHRLASALANLHASEPPSHPLELRDWLLGLPGIGPKTASWVVRNHCGCQRVAVVDVHVHRAGLAAGFFATRWRLPRDYRRFELAFCEVARLAEVSAPALDACIWDQLQALGPAGALVLAR
jgi:N-glycosylase/DNA lyase